jgi:hypothetical protein
MAPAGLKFLIGFVDLESDIWPYWKQGDVYRKPPCPTVADQVTSIIRKAFCDVKPGGNAWARANRHMAVVGRAVFDTPKALDAEIAGLNLVVGAQFVWLGGIDHLALAHHMHIVD